jgi:hypothetical protein
MAPAVLTAWGCTWGARRDQRLRTMERQPHIPSLMENLGVEMNEEQGHASVAFKVLRLFLCAS